MISIWRRWQSGLFVGADTATTTSERVKNRLEQLDVFEVRYFDMNFEIDGECHSQGWIGETIRR